MDDASDLSCKTAPSRPLWRWPSTPRFEQIARLRRTVVMANELYQAGRYSSAGELLPGAGVLS